MKSKANFREGLAVFAAAMAIFMPAALPQAQTAPSDSPGFAVISVKPNHSAGQLGDAQLPKDGYSATNVTLKVLISTAYNVREAQIFGADRHGSIPIAMTWKRKWRVPMSPA